MLILFAVLFGGILTGRLLRRRPLRALGSVITFIIWLLLFMLGTEVGGNEEVMRSLATLGVQALVLCTGALAGSIACAWLLWRSIGGRRTGATDSAAPAPPADAMAVGAGFGYYSLSSIFISELRSVELGTVALLCNVLRELFTLLAAPWVAGRFGPLAAISSGGATTFDTTLPILTRVAGPQYAVVAIFHGCVTDFSVPFLVTFFCSI